MLKNILILILFLTGCTSSNDPSVIQKNAITLSSEGELVGKLKDGREVRRFVINNGDTIGSHNHWLYLVDDSDTVTVNHTVSSGKTSHLKVEVIVEGKKYTLSPESSPNK